MPKDLILTLSDNVPAPSNAANSQINRPPSMKSGYMNTLNPSRSRRRDKGVKTRVTSSCGRSATRSAVRYCTGTGTGAAATSWVTRAVGLRPGSNASITHPSRGYRSALPLCRNWAIHVRRQALQQVVRQRLYVHQRRYLGGRSGSLVPATSGTMGFRSIGHVAL